MTLRSSLLMCAILALAATSVRAGTLGTIEVEFSGTEIMTACSVPGLPSYCTEYLGTSGGEFLLGNPTFPFDSNPCVGDFPLLCNIQDIENLDSTLSYTYTDSSGFRLDKPSEPLTVWLTDDTFQEAWGEVAFWSVNLSFLGIPDPDFPGIPDTGMYSATGMYRFSGEIASFDGSITYTLSGNVFVDVTEAIPEPSTVVMTVVALALLGAPSIPRRLRQRPSL